MNKPRKPRQQLDRQGLFVVLAMATAGTVIWLCQDMLDDLTDKSYPQELLYCRLKKIPFSTISSKSPSFRRYPFRQHFPEVTLQETVHFNTCAVVSSSHAMRTHLYGKEIDAHDAVLRFNCAVVKTFEEFVGSNTTLRLINSQVPSSSKTSHCKTDFWKTNSSFRQEILVMRNVNSITGNLARDKKERFGAIRNYVRYRQSFHSGAFFVHTPGFHEAVHQLQTGFCRKTGTCTKRRSSTSGFLGVLMMLHICDWVTLYEMVPSVAGQRDKREYYWDDVKVMTRGAKESTHSYSADRTVMRKLAVNSEEIDSTGRATLKGFSQVNCD
ncbi:beta-galactoside alpha-2,6-sialyltransferase 2-like [Branchiostoma floridae]|uniref:beta-galactoside alpha-(2,6)-sialyltransferase n=1 Tax=Branchiostoma floridae TaxID=7739 RepID=A0A9J7HV01_BRAFL|nr:beta-galactoside alpha-2,6-sialyltransferase 2-like [Branchiostoma floridae]